MARKYSNPTLAALAEFMAIQFSHSDLEGLFLATSVPDVFQAGSNKHARSLNAIRYLSSLDEFTGEPMYAYSLDLLVEQVIKRTSSVFEHLAEGSQFHYSASRSNDAGASLQRALKVDGFMIVDGQLVPADELELDLSTETSILQQKLISLGMPDVISTLNQAHQNYVDGHLEACNAMLRTSLEGTLKHIAIQIAGGINNIPVRNRHHGVTPVDVRIYLEQEAFFQTDEIEFVKSFYGYASTDGSHPGMSNESESRLRRLMIVALIQYCLEKFQARLV